MHILISNDDGPPSNQSSPYVHSLIKHLQGAGHVVSVCLPHTQRSWIGKAHMIGQTLKPLYYRPSANVHGEDVEGTTHSRPSADGNVEEWILVDGTPASCVQIGLNHFFQDRGPIDLVVSGPNYGRNTTALFALSSGTLGAALEAAVCKRKAIALSFAFFSRNHDPEIIDAACRHSVKVIEALYKQWPTDESADLYSVNVPLVEGVESHKTLWANVLQNYWTDGGCFDEVDDDGEGEGQAERLIREGPGGEANAQQTSNGTSNGHKHKNFKWAPKFADVYKSVEEAGPGNDGWAVKEGHTSITPLKANFAQGPTGDQKELELETSLESSTTATAMPIRTSQNANDTKFQALIAYEDPYVQPLIVDAFESLVPKAMFNLDTDLTSLGEEVSAQKWLSSQTQKALQITPYETIDFEWAGSNAGSYLINSYMIRKALIRKHYLSSTVDHWVAKNPESILKKSVKRSEHFEVDYAEFLDDSLVEAFDLNESLNQNEETASEEEKQWWILKPGMSDRGQGIRLFSTMEELQAIFDQWEEERPDSDDEGEEVEAPGESTQQHGDYITTSHLRHFIAQPYIHPPLLVTEGGNKFHIRTYVLCTGSLNVFVYKHMLALFAAKPYSAPWESPDDIESFLTNTCIQESPNENTVQRFWDIGLEKAKLDDIFEQICGITGEIFEAAARAMPIHFQTLPNAFEPFGLDFMIDANGTVFLLEINAFPDFKQTGGDLQEIVQGFWKGVVREAVLPFFGIDRSSVLDTKGQEDMVAVREIDLGRR